MPPPAAVICEICGGKFSRHSLVIHQKACIKKREDSTSFCPVCDQIVSNDEYGAHLNECQRVNAPLMREKKLEKEKAAKAAKAAATAALKAQGLPAGGVAGIAVGSNNPEAAAAAAAAEKPGSAQQKQRSKIPESVLRRLENAKNNVGKKLTPEEELFQQLGTPCLACGFSKAIVACVGCHTVYCEMCSEMIHEVNLALADHKPIKKEEYASQKAAEEEIPDARVSCNVCNRKFEATRIAKHQLVCVKASHRAPRKSFKSTLEDRLKGTDFEKFNRQALAAVVAAAKAAASAAAAAARKPGSAGSTTSTTTSNAAATKAGGTGAITNTIIATATVLAAAPGAPVITGPDALAQPHKPGSISKLGAVINGLVTPQMAAMAAAAAHADEAKSRWRKEHEQMMSVAGASKTGSTPVKNSGNVAGVSSLLAGGSRGDSNVPAMQALVGAGAGSDSSSTVASTLTAASSPSGSTVSGVGGSSTITSASSVTMMGAGGSNEEGSASTHVTPSKASNAASSSSSGDGAGDSAEATLKSPVKEKPPQVGEKVFLFEKNLVGTLQFKGPVWGLAKGNWYGIEFESASGRNNGSYNGTTYFYCKDGHGLFIRPDKVKKQSDGGGGEAVGAGAGSSTTTTSTTTTTAAASSSAKSSNGTSASSTAAASKPSILARLNASKPSTATTTATTTTTTTTAAAVEAAPAPPATASSPPKQSTLAPAPAASSPGEKTAAKTTSSAATATKIPSPKTKTATSTSSSSVAGGATATKATSSTSSSSSSKPPTPASGSRPTSTASTSRPAATSSSATSANAPAKKPVSSLLTAAPPAAPTPTDGDGGAAGGGFSKSLVDKLRKKVETHRPGTRLVDEVKAKQKAAAEAPATSGTASSTTSTSSAPATKPPTSSSSSSENTLVSHEELRRRDIARNVDFLRVLAGEKTKLAADPSSSKDYVAFNGSGAKLGGDKTNMPTDTGYGLKKKIVTAEGKITMQKGVTDSKDEREKRAAAALARINSLAKMGAAPGSPSGAAVGAGGSSENA